MAEVIIHGYYTNSEDKGNLITGTTKDISELHNLIDEALSYGYYIQIMPSRVLSEERAKNGDVVLMFGKNRLAQR